MKMSTTKHSPRYTSYPAETIDVTQWGDTMRTSIQSIGGGYRVVCSCGYASGELDTRIDTEFAYLNHIRVSNRPPQI